MHLMAKTYGVLPSDLLGLEWWQYDLNAAVLLAGLESENGSARGSNKLPPNLR